MQKVQTQMKIPTEIYSRIVGYFRPVQNWNNGKKQEFEERRYYNISGLKAKGKIKKGTQVA